MCAWAMAILKTTPPGISWTKSKQPDWFYDKTMSFSKNFKRYPYL